MYAGKKLLSVLLLLVMLGSVVSPATAITENNNEILLKRVVVASMDENGKLLLNITWVNQAIEFGNTTCSGNCSCTCSSSDKCSAMPYSVAIDEIYNVSEKEESLKLLNVTVYNESFSYTFYVLGYQVEKQQYNLTVVTRIMSVDNTNFFTTVVNFDPRDDKAQPVVDFIFFENKTTLADHYRLLGDVLNEIRKNDNTSWIWNKVRVEMNDLARKVERDLAGYNVIGFGSAVVMDDECTASCGLLRGMSGATVCLIICSFFGENPLCGLSCAILWGSACAAGCSYVCTGNIDMCSVGCGGFCAGLCSYACRYMGPFAYFCDRYACAPACTGVCEILC